VFLHKEFKGKTPAIIVEELGYEKFKVQDGNHRLLAAKELGLQNVPVHIKGFGDTKLSLQVSYKKGLTDIYNQATKEAEPTGTQKKMEDALIAPKLETKGYSGPVVEVESFGRKEYVPFLEKYKGMDIVKTGENISVWDSKNKTLFVVVIR